MLVVAPFVMLSKLSWWGGETDSLLPTVSRRFLEYSSTGLCICLFYYTVYVLGVRSVAAYRCKGRLPVVTWMDPETKAVLSRSAQPLAGLGGKS